MCPILVGPLAFVEGVAAGVGPAGEMSSDRRLVVRVTISVRVTPACARQARSRLFLHGLT